MKQESILLKNNSKFDYVMKRLVGLFFLLYGIVLIWLFYKESFLPYVPGKFVNDLPAHIKAGVGEGAVYSFAYTVIGFLYKLANSPILVAIFFALVLVATVYLTQKMMEFLLPETNPYVLWVAAIVCNFVISIYLPKASRGLYMGGISPNVYHNITYSLMKLCSILALILFFKIREHYLEGITWKEWLLFAVSLFLTSWAKPNFVFAFAPAMAIILLVDLIKNKVNGKIFWRCVCFGSAVLPSLALLLYQNTVLFPSDANSGIAFGFAVYAKIWSEYPVVSLLQALAFPLFVLLFNLKELKTDKKFSMSWLMLLVGLLEYMFLYESGSRKWHGNFGWGIMIVVFFVFVTCACKLIQNLIRDIDKKKFKSHMLYYILAVFLLMVHFIDGGLFFLKTFLHFCIRN